MDGKVNPQYSCGVGVLISEANTAIYKAADFWQAAFTVRLQ